MSYLSPLQWMALELESTAATLDVQARMVEEQDRDYAFELLAQRDDLLRLAQRARDSMD